MAARPQTALVALLLAALAAGCGDEASRGRALAETVASDFAKECRGAPAPGAAIRRQRDRLCACSEARIAATRMRFGESDASIGAKVRAASESCRQALGRAPADKPAESAGQRGT